jgi:hypothetical protein
MPITRTTEEKNRMKVGVTAITIALLLPFAAYAGPAADSDSDGTADLVDVCSADPTVPSLCPLDTDTDGYGNGCDGDFNLDGVVDFQDIPQFLGDLGVASDTGIGSDQNCDGVVDFQDIPFFLIQLGYASPGPSGLPCAGSVPCP